MKNACASLATHPHRAGMPGGVRFLFPNQLTSASALLTIRLFVIKKNPIFKIANELAFLEG